MNFGNILIGNDQSLSNSFSSSFCAGVSRWFFDLRTVFRKHNLKCAPHPQYTANPLFSPVFDSSDHFSFACNICREIADILVVSRDDRYGDSPTLYFLLRCPFCKTVGRRKIYLEDTGKHALRFPVETKLLVNTPEDCQPGIIRR